MDGSQTGRRFLGDAGIAEPIGYHEAVEAAKEDTRLRYLQHGKKRAKGSSKRKEKNVPRKQVQAQERRAKFPSLKHGAD